jgi:hypothetical protein
MNQIIKKYKTNPKAEGIKRKDGKKKRERGAH